MVYIKQHKTHPPKNNWLLSIGIDKYQHMGKLRNCKRDAKALVEVLLSDYTFEAKRTIELYDQEASRANVLDSLDSLSDKLGSEDNLIIYFAGHGYYKANSQIGFLVPVDGQSGKNHSLIYNSVIRDYIRGIAAHHIFLVVDSCFSGDLILRNRVEKSVIKASETYAERVYGKPSRWGLAAGRIEEVADGISGNHSPFNQSLVTFLKTHHSNKFAVSELITHVSKITTYNADQTPIGGILDKSGHQGGEFVFQKVSKGQAVQEQTPVNPLQKDLQSWNEAKSLHSVAAYKAYIKAFPNGEFRELAESKISQLNEEDSRARKIDYPWEQQGGREERIDRIPSFNEPEKPFDFKKIPFIMSEGIQKEKRYHLNKDLAIEMVKVEGGKFLLGKNQLFIKNIECEISSFEMGKYPVTQAQWMEVMGRNSSHFKNNPDYPVESVSWNDARVFIKKLSKKTGLNFRLPTEAEWEFAAIGGKYSKEFLYAGSNNLDEVGWYKKNSDGSAHPVGRKKANELNLYDMSGNVFEWCSDWEGLYGPGPRLKDPQGPVQGNERIVRGGSWLNHDLNCQVYSRISYKPDLRINNLGFRLVRSV